LLRWQGALAEEPVQLVQQFRQFPLGLVVLVR
jgi:hypothetical protein